MQGSSTWQCPSAPPFVAEWPSPEQVAECVRPSVCGHGLFHFGCCESCRCGHVQGLWALLLALGRRRGRGVSRAQGGPCSRGRAVRATVGPKDLVSPHHPRPTQRGVTGLVGVMPGHKVTKCKPSEEVSRQHWGTAWRTRGSAPGEVWGPGSPGTVGAAGHLSCPEIQAQQWGHPPPGPSGGILGTLEPGPRVPSATQNPPLVPHSQPCPWAGPHQPQPPWPSLNSPGPSLAPYSAWHMCVRGGYMPPAKPPPSRWHQALSGSAKPTAPCPRHL